MPDSYNPVTQIAVSVYDADGDRYMVLINADGTGGLYRQVSANGDQSGMKLDEKLLDVILDIPFKEFEAWPYDRRWTSAVYNGGQFVGELLNEI